MARHTVECYGGTEVTTQQTYKDAGLPTPGELARRIHQLGAQQATNQMAHTVRAATRHTGDTVRIRGKFGATTQVGSAQPFTFSRTMRTQDGQLLSVVSTRAAAKMAAEADTPLAQTTIVTEKDATGRVVSRRLNVDKVSPRRQPRPSLAAKLMVVHRQTDTNNAPTPTATHSPPPRSRCDAKPKSPSVVRTCSTPSRCASPRSSRRSVIARDIVHLPEITSPAARHDAARALIQRERFASFQSHRITPRAMHTTPNTPSPSTSRSPATRTRHSTLKAPCVIMMASPLPRSPASSRAVSVASRPAVTSKFTTNADDEAAVDYYVR